MTGMYAMHYAVSGCPIAAKNKASAAQANKVHVLLCISHFSCCTAAHRAFIQ